MVPDEVDDVILKTWQKAIQNQARSVAQNRQNALNAKEQNTVILTDDESVHTDQLHQVSGPTTCPRPCTSAESDHEGTTAYTTSKETERL